MGSTSSRSTTSPASTTWPTFSNTTLSTGATTVRSAPRTGALLVDGRRIAAFAERKPANLPWADLGVDLVLECTGVFKTENDLKKHIQAGASFVILCAPTTSR